MSKIIIDNVAFDYDLGCRLLKLKHTESPFEQLNDFWDEIVPLTFKEIAKFPNLEQRRIGIVALGIDKLIQSVNPILIDSQTIKKSTTWIDENNQLVTREFEDTYELYRVNADYFNEGLENSWQKSEDCHFVKCKDTSTDREYLIWVNLMEVFRTNNETKGYFFHEKQRAYEDRVNAIQCIAWTIQTNVMKNNIEKIVRQGDCVLIKPFNANGIDKVRHLTEYEYRNLLVAES